MTEMARSQSKVVGIVRRAIEEYMEERLPPEIDDNTLIRDESLSEEVRSLRQDLNFVRRPFGSSYTILIDISCPDGLISSGMSTLAKAYLDKKEKYTRLAEETSNIRQMHMEVIPIILSSLGAVQAKT
jgi:hypothetical protein